MGTFRALDEYLGLESHNHMNRIVDQVAKKYNIKIDLEYKKG